MIIFGLGLFMYAAWSALQCRSLPICILNHLLSAAMKIGACMGGIVYMLQLMLVCLVLQIEIC